jgi:hypothetical protein
VKSTLIVTLPVKVVARGLGLARGTVSETRRLAREVTSPSSSWTAATDSPERSAPVDDPAPVSLGTEPGPVNVTEELGLDPAPLDRPRERRTPAVTGIDQQAEPGLVDSTPADVAARIARAGS